MALRGFYYLTGSDDDPVLMQRLQSSQWAVRHKMFKEANSPGGISLLLSWENHPGKFASLNILCRTGHCDWGLLFDCETNGSFAALHSTLLIVHGTGIVRRVECSRLLLVCGSFLILSAPHLRWNSSTVNKPFQSHYWNPLIVGRKPSNVLNAGLVEILY